MFAESPEVTRYTRVLQRIRYLLRRSGCFRPRDRLAGWDLHPLEIADFHGVPDDEDHEILLDRALEDSEVVYFFMSTLEDAMTSRLIAGLGLYTAIGAAIQRNRRGAPPRHAHILVDEFQELAGRSFAALLAQSRKHHVSLYLAHQSTSQLESRDLDLAPVVFEGTICKQYFSCVGPKDTEILQSLSKDKLKAITGSGGSPFSKTKYVTTVLERDEILDVTYTDGHSFLVVNDGRGHHEPLRIDSPHDVSYDDYVKLRNMPLAEAEVSEKEPAESVETPPGDDAAIQKRRDDLRQLGKNIGDETKWN